MTATIHSHPHRVRRLFEIVRDPMHPEFHAGLAGLRRAAFDTEVCNFHRNALRERLAQIESVQIGRAYNPDNGAA